MTRIFQSLCIAAAVALTAAPAVSMAADKDATKGGTVVLSQTVRAKATVVDIKKTEREITLRDEKGSEAVVVAGEEVRNFDQIAKGDIIEITYQRAAASALEKVGDTNVAGQSTAVERAPAGAKPGVKAQRMSSIVATVLEIDTKSRLLTVQGPKGGIVTIEVPADVKAFDSLKKGDRISAVYAEALAISVKTPKK